LGKSRPFTEKSGQMRKTWKHPENPVKSGKIRYYTGKSEKNPGNPENSRLCIFDTSG